MADEIQKSDFQNAKVDATTISDVANGAADFNGDGYVNQRLGGRIRTLAKLLDDLATTDVSGALAAALRSDIGENPGGLGVAPDLFTMAVPAWLATMPQAQCFYSLPAYYDIDGTRGHARRLYFPLSFQIQRNGHTTTYADIGSAAAELNTHTAIDVPEATGVHAIWLSLAPADAGARLKIATVVGDLPANDGNAVPICTIRNRRIQEARFEIVPLTRDGLPHPKGRIVVRADGKTIDIPGIFGSNGDYAYNDGGYSGLFKQTYVIQSVATSPVWVYLDLHTGLIGEYVGSTMPHEPLYQVLLVRNNGEFGSPSGYPLIGAPLAGTCTPNLATFERGHPEDAPTIFGTLGELAEVVTLANLDQTYVADAIDMGYSSAVRNTNGATGAQASANGKLWVGGPVVDSRPGERAIIFVRVINLAGTGFGNPRGTFIDGAGNAYATPVTLDLYELHNAGFATFAGWGTIPDGFDTRTLTGGTFGTSPTDQWLIVDCWYGIAPEDRWISETDQGGRHQVADLVAMNGDAVGLSEIQMGPKIYMLDDRPTLIHPANVFTRRSHARDVTLTMQKKDPADGSPSWARSAHGDGQIVMRPADLAGVTKIWASAYSRSAGPGADNMRLLEIEPVVVPRAAVVGRSPVVIAFADSTLGTNGMAHRALDAMLYSGMVGPIFYGTIACDERLTNMPTPTTGRLINLEAREGKRMGDYSGEGGNPLATMVPVAYGAEGTYLAAINSVRKGMNPWLRNVDYSDSDFVMRRAFKPTAIVNGSPKIFYDELHAGNDPDPAEYWTFSAKRGQEITGLPTPDYVWIQLGTNEMNDFFNGTQTTVSPIVTIRRGLEAMLSDMQLHWPNSRLFVSVPGISWVDFAIERYADQIEGQGIFVQTVMEAAAGLSLDEYIQPVEFLNLHAVANGLTQFYPITTTPGAAFDQLITANEVVHTHPGASREQPGEQFAAAVAAYEAHLS